MAATGWGRTAGSAADVVHAVHPGHVDEVMSDAVAAVAGDAVGAVGVPVSAGDASGAIAGDIRHPADMYALLPAERAP